MTGPAGNSEFCFPSTAMFPSASPRETFGVPGKQTSLFPLWPVIECLMPPKNWKVIYLYTWSAASAVLSTKQIKLPSSLCNVEKNEECFFFFFGPRTRSLKTEGIQRTVRGLPSIYEAKNERESLCVILSSLLAKWGHATT